MRKAAMSLLLLLSTVCSAGDAGVLNVETHPHRVHLSWNNSGWNCTWSVLRSTIEGGYYREIAFGAPCGSDSEVPSQTTYDDTDVAPGETYFYVAMRRNHTSQDEEARTNEVRVTVP